VVFRVEVGWLDWVDFRVVEGVDSVGIAVDRLLWVGPWVECDVDWLLWEVVCPSWVVSVTDSGVLVWVLLVGSFGVVEVVLDCSVVVCLEVEEGDVEEEEDWEVDEGEDWEVDDGLVLDSLVVDGVGVVVTVVENVVLVATSIECSIFPMMSPSSDEIVCAFLSSPAS
jgi:hypothetical protein